MSKSKILCEVQGDIFDLIFNLSFIHQMLEAISMKINAQN